MLAPELVVPIVATFVCPRLNTSSVLQIVLPFSFVHCSINMFIHPRAICFVICPKTIVHVSIDVDKLAFSVSAILPPLSDVLGAIRPGLFPKTITKATLPLACVHCSSFKLVRGSLLSWLIGFVKAFRHSLPCFFLSEVFGRSQLLRS